MKYKIVADNKEDECVFTDELFNSEAEAYNSAVNRISELKMAVGDHIYIPYHIDKVEHSSITDIGYKGIIDAQEPDSWEEEVEVKPDYSCAYDCTPSSYDFYI